MYRLLNTKYTQFFSVIRKSSSKFAVFIALHLLQSLEHKFSYSGMSPHADQGVEVEIFD